MENSLHETKEIQWDWDEDDNGDVAEFVVIDGEKYVDVSYFNQKLKEKEDRFELHKNTDAKTIQDQSDLIEELNSKIKKLIEEIDLYNSLTPDKADWMAQYLGLLRDTNDERSLLEKEITDLEAKLAESEIRSKESEIFYKREINRRDTKLRNIKQQLAEKDEELKYYETLLKRQCNECKDQDKISFAVEQLEKVKEKLIQNEDCYMISLGTIKNIIDNQIEAIEEKK